MGGKGGELPPKKKRTELATTFVQARGEVREK